MASLTHFDTFSEFAKFNPFGPRFLKGFLLNPISPQFESEPQMRVDMTEDDKAALTRAKENLNHV